MNLPSHLPCSPAYDLGASHGKLQDGRIPRHGYPQLRIAGSVMVCLLRGSPDALIPGVVPGIFLEFPIACLYITLPRLVPMISFGYYPSFKNFIILYYIDFAHMFIKHLLYDRYSENMHS